METEVVLGASHVEGVRIFAVDLNKLLLKSLTANDPEHLFWMPGEIYQSQCGRSMAHRDLKPAIDCTCGVWSCKSRRMLNHTYKPGQMGIDGGSWFPLNFIYGESVRKPQIDHRKDIVSARIQQWGVVIEHRFGYRSEFARIIPETIQFYPRPRTPKDNKLLKYLRRKYGA